MDPDFHRRDLADAIEAGAFPEWELGVRTFPDTEDQVFEGIDLLDPAKIVPDELAPVLHQRLLNDLSRIRPVHLDLGPGDRAGRTETAGPAERPMV